MHTDGLVTDPVRLSVAVQHHPSRAHLLHRFDGLDADVIEDPAPHETSSPWRTYQQCLAATPDDCTHRLILQDDTVPCDGFLDAARAAVAACPSVMVAFFVPMSMRHGADAVRRARAAGHAWVDLAPQAPAWIPVVALCWPRHVAADMVAWDAAQRSRGQRADDAHVGRFVRDRCARVWATVPSLVEHPDDTPSLIGNKHRQRKRQAAVYGTGMGVDWSRC